MAGAEAKAKEEALLERAAVLKVRRSCTKSVCVRARACVFSNANAETRVRA